MDDQTPFKPDDPGIAFFNRTGWKIFACVAIVFMTWHLFKPLAFLFFVLFGLYWAWWFVKDTEWGRALEHDLARLRAVIWDAIFARLFNRAPSDGAAAYANPYQQRQHETQARATEGELDRMALFSAASDDSSFVFVSQARAAMEKRLNDLLLIPHLTIAQQQERTALERWIMEDRARSNELAGFIAPSAAPVAPQGLLSGVARAALQPWHLWIVGGLVALNGVQFAAGAVQGRNLDAAKARADHNQSVAIEWRDRAAQFEDAYTRQSEAMAQVNAARMHDQRVSRAMIEDQQRRQVRAQMRERARRESEIRSIDAPPDWGGLLRDVAGDQPAGSAAADSGGGDAPAADHPAG